MSVFQDLLLEWGLREFHDKEDKVLENVVVPIAYTVVLARVSGEN